MVQLEKPKREKQRVDTWVMFIIGAALVALGVQCSLWDLEAFATFGFITGIGTEIAVLARVMGEY